jgi:hypothetical protein
VHAKNLFKQKQQQNPKQKTNNKNVKHIHHFKRAQCNNLYLPRKSAVNLILFVVLGFELRALHTG